MRCNRCILTNSVPGITFNEDGICNFCLENYPPYFPLGDDELRKILSMNVRPETQADCLVGLSGGKDSTYALIKLKTEFNMRVEAFTYMHEGSTGFSLENAKKTCQKLGIKHHIISLDKHAHLNTFKGYFRAWLKSPSPTSAAMTCVACKHLHLIGNNIARERNIPMIIWSSTPLEAPQFVAVKRNLVDNKFKTMSNAKSGLLIMKEMVKTFEFPVTFMKYFNTSYKGCLSVSPSSTYIQKKFPDVKPIYFFSYHQWNPEIIKKYIKSKVDWEIPGNREDWHSDCLFHYMKEYMFLKMMNTSYEDAHLSNQIRHGIITRENALAQLKLSRKNNAIGLSAALDTLNLNDFRNQIDFNVFESKEDI